MGRRLRGAPSIPAPGLVPTVASTREVRRHPESWIPPAELGSRIPPYAPTYELGTTCGEGQAAILASPLREGVLVDMGIPGWLRVEDALKLYEMAFCAEGDILELGTFQGLSTCIMAGALRDAGARHRILSVDLDADASARAAAHLGERGLAAHVDLRVSDAADFCRRLVRAERRFAFVFVDHSHAYAHVAAVCRLMADLIGPRGFCLFHDFNDARNQDLGNADYGVSRAVVDELSADAFEPFGIYGCTALYRARR